jgi:hypothetical protein
MADRTGDDAMSEHDELCDRIWYAIPNGTSIPDVLDALCAVITRAVSLLDCADCRKQAMRAFKQSIAGMLTRANAAAARRVADNGSTMATPHMHH